MKLRRRSRVKVAVKEVPERPLGTTAGEVAALRALHTKTSAHEVNEPTPCAVCGGPCAPGSVHWGTWRRHEGCQSLAGDPVGRLVAAGRALGHDLSRQDAILLLEADLVAAKPYSDTHSEPTWTDEPTRERMRWHHVDRQALREALEALPSLRADCGLDESICADGPCAWCGVRSALGLWQSRGHVWPDGTSAPLCAACAEVFDRNGLSESSWWDDQRAGIAEAVSGVPWPMGTAPPAGLRAFAEVEKRSDLTSSEAESTSSSRSAEAEGVSSDTLAEGADGTSAICDGTPWSHLPAEPLDAFRWSAWALYGGQYAPPEHRAEALERARAADAAWSARQAARLAEEARKADVYGFGGAA